MESYEKKYKDALGWMQSVYPTMTGADKEDAEHFFPELKESEDERIRKGIIRNLQYLADRAEGFVKDELAERIAWLEKQGEQKPADKVEPKFKVGEWIVWENKCYKVNYNGCGYELIDQNGLRTSLEYGTVDTSSRLWDITIDAKDGDVLLASDDSIFIFKEVVDLGCKHYIALEEEDGTIQVNDNFAHCWESVTGVFPATKEQRDTLEKAMADAGYTFDFDKKELKKIVQKPAWSEEDKQHIDSLLKRLDGLCRNEFERTRFAISEDKDWLKSLKQRIG